MVVMPDRFEPRYRRVGGEPPAPPRNVDVNAVARFGAMKVVIYALLVTAIAHGAYHYVTDDLLLPLLLALGGSACVVALVIRADRS
jgi:hypothetical protein